MNRREHDEEPVLEVIRRSARGGAALSDLFIVKQPEEDAPQELYWTCSTCGPIEPYATPMGRWIRRSCACEKRARKEAQEAELFQAWKAEQASRCYGKWLGPRWIDDKTARTLSAKTFENFDKSIDPKMYETMLAFADAAARGKTSKNVVLAGTFGSGKTHLEAAVLNYLRERRVNSLFVSSPLFFKAYNDLLRHDGDAAGLLKSAMDTPVLVFDDLDKAAPSEAKEDTYFLLFDERYKAGRPTIVSTNKFTTLAHYIGDAAYSRLTAKCKVIETTGGNYRVDEMLNDEDEEF